MCIRDRVEADGVVLADVDRLVEDVSVAPAEGGGQAEVVVRVDGRVVRARAGSVTVSGSDFRYRADAAVAGPVRRRTWTLRPAAWGLVLPR